MPQIDENNIQPQNPQLVPTKPQPNELPVPSETKPVTLKKIVGVILGIIITATAFGTLIGFLYNKGLLLPKLAHIFTPLQEKTKPLVLTPQPKPQSTIPKNNEAELVNPNGINSIDQLSEELDKIEGDLENLDQIDGELNAPEIEFEL